MKTNAHISAKLISIQTKTEIREIIVVPGIDHGAVGGGLKRSQKKEI